MFLPRGWLTPVLPPTEESTMAITVVGIYDVFWRGKGEWSELVDHDDQYYVESNHHRASRSIMSCNAIIITSKAHTHPTAPLSVQI